MILGSNQSPSDIETMVMVLNDAGDRFVEQYKPIEEVRAVFLRRFDEKANIELNWHYPIDPNNSVYDAFLNADKSYEEVKTELNLDASLTENEIVVKSYANANQRDMRELLSKKTETTRQAIVEATSIEEIIKLFEEFVPSIDTGGDDICPDCMAFRALLQQQIPKNFVKHTTALVNQMWFDLGRECATSEFDNLVRVFRMEKTKAETISDETLGDTLVFCRQDFPVRLGADVEDKTALDVIGHAVHAFWMPVDRSGTLPTPGIKMSGESIPDATNYSNTLEDVMLAEAQRIWNLNREFRVYWSGGIDSTGMLVALLRTAQTGDLDRMTVVYSDNDPHRSSVVEYPKFFAEHIDGKLNKFACHAGPHNKWYGSPLRMLSSFIGNDMTHHAQSGVLCVTGELGDQMFGSAAFSNNADFINMTTAEYLQQDQFQPFIEDITRFNAASPVDTTNLVDCLWWWNFAVKWQEVRYRAAVGLEDGNALQNVHAFFGGEDFQKWSIANPDKKIKDTPASYKFSLKDFIYDFTGDADYRDKKLKEGSLRVRVGAMAAIDDRSNIIKFGHTSTSETLMRERYGNTLSRFVK